MNHRKDLLSAKILYDEAKKLGLNPVWITEYGLFSFERADRTEFVFYGRTSLNSQVASYLATNKHCTRAVLEKNGFVNIPYLLPDSGENADAFLSAHKKIVVKPTLGQQSLDVHVIETSQQLAQLNLTDKILEKFISGTEFRYLVLQESVVAVRRKEYMSPDNLESVRRISLETDTWDADLVHTALQVAKVLGLQFAAVDFLVEESGQTFILEVNSAPGIAWVHEPDEGPSVNVANLLLKALMAKPATTKN